MDRRTARRVAPGLYAIAIVACLLFAHGALIAVVIIGAMLLGLTYTAMSGGPGRARNRNRNRGGR